MKWRVSELSKGSNLSVGPWRKLDHSNIVPVYEYGYNEDHAFLVMKFIDGHSLDKILCPDAQYRLKVLLAELQSDWKAFAELGMKVASGLQHAHEQGLVHRDIKPANLLFDKSRKIWITDFGLAKAFDHKSLPESDRRRDWHASVHGTGTASWALRLSK